MTKNTIIEFDLHFNVLKSDGGLSDVQQENTDELPPFSLGTNTKYFHFVSITEIEKETLFYIQALGMDPKVILIKRGDAVF